MFWILSKLFWLVAQPPVLVGILVLSGLLFTFSRRKRLGQALVGAGLLLLLVLGFTNIGILLLQPLEARYARPAFFPDNAAGIIVLGGGTDNAVSSARGHYELADSGDRYVEAMRLALAHPDLPVLVSGGVGQLDGAGETDAQSIARLFAAFGLAGPHIRYESTSRNTYENAVDSAALVHPQPGQPYVLITSAYHMPRSVMLFEAAGFDIVPWPVDYHTTGQEGLAFSPVAASGNIAVATTGLKEWIGLVAYWAAGRIPRPLP